MKALVVGIVASQSLFASAFVSRSNNGRIIQQRSFCPLQVLSSPPESKATPTQQGDEKETNASLFQMEDESDVASSLFQIEEVTEEEEEVSVEPGDVSSEVNLREGEEDYSFFYRDDDDMMSEREDRNYVDDKGIRKKVERCILVGVEDLTVQRRARKAEKYFDPLADEETADAPVFSLEESLTEMRELIRTAGLEIGGEITQRLQKVEPRTYIGTGKVLECKALMEETDSTTIVFDAELSPGQQKSLENAFNRNAIENDFLGVGDREIKVVDRTALILDIFAQHAKTREGKLQVDLALHEYRKPRLTKMWTHLERQSGAGGVGLRGPGESQLEIDKRLVRDRIIVLKKKIDDVQKQRSMHRKGRQRTGLPILAVVGYTNAGKSSLLNYLTRAGVLAEAMLFATLDPTTRKVKLPGYKTHPEVLLTDTVGFIQKLPTNLVAAFRATLEEVEEADVLIHVIDVSHPAWEKQERAVRNVLAGMDVADKPVVRVLNKIDLLDAEDAEYLQYEAAMSDNTVAVSALYGDGMQDFVAVVEEALSDLLVPIEMEIPYNMGHELNTIHEQGAVETIDYRPNGTYVLGRVPTAVANRLAAYSVAQEGSTIDAQSKTDNGEEEIDWVALGRGRHEQPSDEESI
jgi:GTP-binding protein HflX